MWGLSIHLDMKIDLNCDMGEGMHTDAEIMPFISSANIACGGHAGNASTMLQTIQLAKKYNVAVGAHPSYPDRNNFGRVEMHLTANEIYNEVYHQIVLIKEIAKNEEVELHHIKPHGALYNTAARNKIVASAIVDAIMAVDTSLKIYGLPSSVFEQVCIDAGMNFIGEGFADRTYTDEGTLTPRNLPNALITEKSQSIEQVMKMITQGKIKTTSGKSISMDIKTICIHGDGEHAVEFAQHIHDTLINNGILITH